MDSQLLEYYDWNECSNVDHSGIMGICRSRVLKMGKKLEGWPLMTPGEPARRFPSSDMLAVTMDWSTLS